jgi:hypothetical protein
MKKKLAVLATEDDLLVDLTFHNVPASLLAEFAEKIVRPYYAGNMNAAIQDLMHKALAEKDFFLSHINAIRSGNNVAVRKLPHKKALEETLSEGTKIVKDELEHFLEGRDRQALPCSSESSSNTCPLDRNKRSSRNSKSIHSKRRNSLQNNRKPQSSHDNTGERKRLQS